MTAHPSLLPLLDHRARSLAASVDRAVIHRGDFVAWQRGREWLAQNGHIPRAHAVLCDPPYGLAFMNSQWDDMGPHEYQAWCTEWGRLLLSFVYPGAVLMAFGGTRTYHRLAAGLEDAGWIVADCLMWTFASGFPKSHSISKAIDREVGAKREIVGESPDSAQRNATTFQAQTNKSGYTKHAEGRRLLSAPATDAARHWDGYGTALAPAYEPIVLARAPWSGTYAQTAQQYGTGALNIEGSRIPANGNAPKGWETPRGGIWATDKDAKSALIENLNGRWPKNLILSCACTGDEHTLGCPVSIIGEQSGESKDTAHKRNGRDLGMFPAPRKEDLERGHNDSGTAARMFFQAKAARWEREAGLHDYAQTTVGDGRKKSIDNPYQRGETKRRNIHPTCKPIQLTEYLARLLLPPPLSEPRRLLVPFSGSGSEMIGAVLAGWDAVIGFEQSDAYADIAEARLKWWGQFKDYDMAKRAWDADQAEAAVREAERAAGVEQLALWEVA